MAVERTGGTKPRGRYASETCRNAKRCRARKRDDRASGKGSAPPSAPPKKSPDPPGRILIVLIDDYHA